MGIALITNNILSDSGTAVAGLVPTSRTISTTAPLTGGGDLSADRTFAIPAATTSVNGYLSSVDWTTFNAKQVAGNYIVSLTGEATAVGPGAAAVTLNNASVTGKVLTGVNITGGTVLATDTMLTAFGKLQNQINGLVGSTIYQGVWDASTNTPTLTSSVGTNGFYYIVNVAGSTNLNGITDWKIGDWAIFNGGVWQKVDNTESVTSVNGFTGAVSLTTDNVAQGTTNLYFANSLARAAISLTVTGSSGASTYNNTTGVLNVPTYTLSGLGGQPLATNLTSLSGLTFVSTAFVKMTAAGTFALDTTAYGTGSVTSVAALTLGTTGTDLSSTVANSTTTPVITLNVPTASAVNRGALSAADWTTFNNKQSALTNPVTGTGTTNYLPKFTGASTIGNSAITDDGTTVTLVSRALSGTSATFSGNIRGAKLSLGTATTTYPINVEDGTQSNSYFTLFNTIGTAGATAGLRFGIANGTLTTGGAAEIVSRGLTASDAAMDLKVMYNYSLVNALTLGSNGAATFSSSVTATQFNASISTSGAVASVPNLAYFKNQGNGYVAKIAIGEGTTSDSFITHTGGNTTATQLLGFGVNAYNQMVLTGAGNVGIGTTSPSALLHLQNSAGSTLRLVRTSNRFDISADNDFMEINARDASTYMTFKTADTERMRITSAGNVVVNTGGTSAPNAGQLVNRQRSDSTTPFLNGIVNMAQANSSYLGMYYDGSTHIISASYYTGGDGGAYKPLAFYTGDTERMRITSGGNVLINRSTDLATSSGTTRLVVNGAVNVGSGVGNTSFASKDDGGLGVYVGSGVNAFQVWDDNNFSNPRFIIQRAGNVGIGTTSPTDKLDVVGEVVFGPQTEKLSMGSASLAFNRKVATGLIYDSSRFAYQFQHTGSTSSGSDYLALQVYNPSGVSVTANALVVNGVGNVLIGTTTDAGHKFDVNGIVRFINSYGIDTRFGDASSFVLNSQKTGMTNGTSTAFLMGKANSANNQMTLIYNHVSDGSTSNYLGLGFYGADNLFKLYPTGAATFSSSVTATSFFESSSVAFKNILATNPITSLNVDVIKYKRTNVDVDDVRYGYSAEQINSLMPELTNKEATAVKYLDVHTLLIAELQREIKELKARLN